MSLIIYENLSVCMYVLQFVFSEYMDQVDACVRTGMYITMIVHQTF